MKTIILILALLLIGCENPQQINNKPQASGKQGATGLIVTVLGANGNKINHYTTTAIIHKDSLSNFVLSVVDEEIEIPIDSTSIQFIKISQ